MVNVMMERVDVKKTGLEKRVINPCVLVRAIFICHCMFKANVKRFSVEQN